MTTPAARTNHSYANAAAITAIPPNERQNGDEVWNVDTDIGYHFDAAAVSGGLTPDAGTGRWIADTVSGGAMLADLASTANGDGASLIGIEDAATNFAATTVEGALAEIVADLAATTATNGASRIGVEDAALRFAGATAETVTAELGGRVGAAVADTTALQAVVAATRSSAQIVVKLDTNDPWIFDADSAVGADAWTIVPGAGTGRWVRPWPSLLDLSTTGSATLGANLMGIRDVANIYTATTVEGALAEVKVLADAAIGAVKRTVTVGHADLTEAGNGAAQSINLGAVLPANARITYVDAHDFTPFTGGGAGAVTLTIGSSGDLDAIVSSSDVFAAAVDGGPSTFTPGIRPNKLFATIGAQLLATFTPDGGAALLGLSAGSIIVDVYYFVSA